MESSHRRITVWYTDDADEDGASKPWHGDVVRLCIDRGFQVRFDDCPEEHPDKTMWVSRTEDDWAWGNHKRKPSQKAIEAAELEGTGQANRKRPRMNKNHQLVVGASRGKRAWTGIWMECSNLLETMRCKILDTIRISPHRAAKARKCEFRMDGFVSEGLDAQGMTYLTNGSIFVLGIVPTKLWCPRSWPLYNCDWSARLRSAQTPEDLLKWLKLARDECIQWPKRASEATSATAADDADDAVDADAQPPASDGEPGGAFAESGGVCSPSDLANGSRCFVCAHTGELERHPRGANGPLRNLMVCRDCSKYFKEVEAEMGVCDEELLRLRCGACAHKDAALHGCRACGESLCERCLHCLHGMQGLHGARQHRFEPELCAGCGRDGSMDDAWRAVCDTCRQQWHLPCHQPPLSAPPGGSQRWLCMDCEVDGEPLTPSWSLRSCSLCAAHEKTRGERRFLQLDQSSEAARIPCNDFDHPSALRAMNEEVEATNKMLADSSEFALDRDAIKQTAEHAVACGGVTVVSYCDGKGTMLGVLLRAGVQVRRYLSVECDENASRVCFSLYGGADQPNLASDGLRFYVDAKQLSVPKLKALGCWPVHLLMGATPCDDLSGCKLGAVGLDGPSSRLFRNYCALVDVLRTNNDGVALCFLAENVKPVMCADQDEMLQLIRVPALQSEAAVFEAARRKRLFFSNMPFASVPLDTRNVLLQSILRPGAVALSSKAGCIISSTMSGGRESIASAKAASQRNRGRELVRSCAHGTEVRGLLVDELAMALGQPHYEVDSSRGGTQEKAALLGRSFSIGQIHHAAQTFIDASLIAQSQSAAEPERVDDVLLLTHKSTEAESTAEWDANSLSVSPSCSSGPQMTGAQAPTPCRYTEDDLQRARRR